MRGNERLFGIKKNSKSEPQIQAEIRIVSRLQSEGKGFLGEKGKG